MAKPIKWEETNLFLLNVANKGELFVLLQTRFAFQ